MQTCTHAYTRAHAYAHTIAPPHTHADTRTHAHVCVPTHTRLRTPDRIARTRTCEYSRTRMPTRPPAVARNTHAHTRASEPPGRSRARRSRVFDTISVLVVGHRGTCSSQPPSCPPSGRRRVGCPKHVVPCAEPSVRHHSESEACHAAALHAPGTKAAERPRWHRRRRPLTRSAHFAATGACE